MRRNIVRAAEWLVYFGGEKGSRQTDRVSLGQTERIYESYWYTPLIWWLNDRFVPQADRCWPCRWQLPETCEANSVANCDYRPRRHCHMNSSERGAFTACMVRLSASPLDKTATVHHRAFCVAIRPVLRQQLKPALIDQMA
jgi:hypothetical protein